MWEGLRGGGLGQGGLGRDDFGGFVLGGLPAVLLLAGNDKDPLAGGRFAEAGGVEGGDVASAGVGGGQQAEVSDAAALHPRPFRVGWPLDFRRRVLP